MLHTKKGIRQRNGINLRHGWIIHKVWINEEKNRHIDRLARIQSLLLKAKTLYLAEIGRNLRWRDAICCHADNVFVALVCRGVKCQRGLPGENANFSLLRCELPRHHVRDGAVECYSQTSGRCYRLETCGWLFGRRRMDASFYRLTAPASLLAYLWAWV